MNRLALCAYYRSPVFAQNAFTSLYGAYLSRRRYGSVFRQQREHLAVTERYAAGELQRLQGRLAAEIVTHAARHVPFYREALGNRAALPDFGAGTDWLSALPMISKDDLRIRPADFIAEGEPTRRTAIYTSGTTGTPLRVEASRDAVQMNYAFFARFLTWAGVTLKQPSATFAGRPILPPGQERPPFWRVNAWMNNVLFSSYHLSDRTMPAYIGRLERLNPRFIDSYPSAIYVIARFILDHDVRHSIRPRAIVTSSETLMDFQRDAIEQAFGCRVFDQYGSAEMVAFVAQCERGRYHVNPEYGIVETVGSDGRPVGFDAPGEMVCTGFLNYAMPLLRYRTGDTAILSSETCDCGRHFPVVKQIVGRTDDCIVTRDGRRIGRLDPIFKGAGAIREAQIVQDDLDALTLRIVRGVGFQPSVADGVVLELKRRVGPSMHVTVEFLDQIPRTRSGKFRAVVSQLN